GAALLFGGVSSFLSLVFGSLQIGDKQFRAGGYIGERLAAILAAYFNRTGSIILILTLLFLAIILSTQFSFGRLFAAISEHVRNRWTAMKASIARRRDDKAREKQRQEVLKKHLGKDSRDFSKEATDLPLVIAKDLRSPAAGPRDALPAASNPPAAPRSRTAAVMSAAASALKAAASKPTPPIKRLPPALKEPPLPLADMEKTAVERRKGAFTLPPYALLDAAKGERKIDERELMDGARLLEEKCREFAVEGTVVQIHPGPVVTTYEFKPDAGVKYSKITGLADDLCLAMQAESV